MKVKKTVSDDAREDQWEVHSTDKVQHNSSTHSRYSLDVLSECSCRVSRHGHVHASPHTTLLGCNWQSPRWHCSMSRRCETRGELAPVKGRNSSTTSSFTSSSQTSRIKNYLPLSYLSLPCTHWNFMLGSFGLIQISIKLEDHSPHGSSIFCLFLHDLVSLTWKCYSTKCICSFTGGNQLGFSL